MEIKRKIIYIFIFVLFTAVFSSCNFKSYQSSLSQPEDKFTTRKKKGISTEPWQKSSSNMDSEPKDNGRKRSQASTNPWVAKRRSSSANYRKFERQGSLSHINRSDVDPNPNQSISAGVIIGPTIPFTDIGCPRKTDILTKLAHHGTQTRYNIGAFGRYKHDAMLSGLFSFTYGRLVGADKVTKDRTRNFSLTNNVYEIAFNPEFHFPEVITGQKGGGFSTFDWYAYTGLNFIIHNPKLETHGIAVPPVTIKKFRLAIPLGFGGFYNYSSGWKWGFDIGVRKLFIDYLDGYIPDGSKAKDYYFFGSIRIAKTIFAKPKDPNANFYKPKLKRQKAEEGTLKFRGNLFFNKKS